MKSYTVYLIEKPIISVLPDIAELGVAADT